MEISAALASLRAAFDLAKVGLEARDDAKIKEAVSAMAERLTDTLLAGVASAEKIAALSSQVEELRAKLREAEERERVRSSYSLLEIHPGTFVRAFSPAEGDTTPAHYQCQVCFGKGIDSVLQRSINGALLCCLVDPKHHLRMPDSPAAPVPTPPRDRLRVRNW